MEDWKRGPGGGGLASVLIVSGSSPEKQLNSNIKREQYSAWLGMVRLHK